MQIDIDRIDYILCKQSIGVTKVDFDNFKESLYHQESAESSTDFIKNIAANSFTTEVDMLKSQIIINKHGASISKYV